MRDVSRHFKRALGALFCCLLAALALCLANGCQRAKTKNRALEPGSPAKTGQGGIKPVATPAGTPKAKDAKTSPTGPVERPGNPAAWGPSAQVSVGRQFEPVYFETPSAELDYNARQRLLEYAQWFKEHPRVWAALAGYAGGRDTVRFAYNLGMARALAVQDHLIGLGMARERFYPITFGGDRPAAQGDSPEAQSMNSRVEIMAFIAPLGQESPAPIGAGKQPPPDVQAEQVVPPTEEIR